MERTSYSGFRVLSRILALLALGWVLLARASSAAPQLSLKDEAVARKLYLGKCAKCHKLYDPAKYPDRRWDLWFSKMSKKAKLTANEHELLSDYIMQTYRSRPREPQPSTRK